MKFNEYLKLCREKTRFTQEELVNELYGFDINNFKGLNTSTLSKWERSVTQPKIPKQVSIVKFFQKLTGHALPYWDGYSIDDVERLLYKTGIKNIINKSKKYILGFPSKSMQLEDINIYLLKDSPKMNALLELNMLIHQEYNHEYEQISLEQFKVWATHSSNFFLMCEYKDTFMGLFFTIRLKPDIFEKIINFEMKKNEITTENFASFDEQGCEYILSIFALNDKSSYPLFMRYYAYLISNQKNIEEVGTIKSEKDAKNIFERMNFKPVNSKVYTNEEVEIVSYKETLSNLLVGENVVKIILT